MWVQMNIMQHKKLIVDSSDDMLKYVQNSGRTARIWGSLTQCSGKTPVRS